MQDLLFVCGQVKHGKGTSAPDPKVEVNGNRAGGDTDCGSQKFMKLQSSMLPIQLGLSLR